MPTKRPFSALKKCHELLNRLKDNDARRIVLEGLSQEQANGLKLMLSIAFVAAHNEDSKDTPEAQIAFDSIPFNQIVLGTQVGKKEHIHTQWDETKKTFTLQFPEAAKPYQMQVFLTIFKNDLFSRGEQDRVDFGNDKQEDVYICSYHNKNELMADAMMILGLMQAHGMNHNAELALASEHNPPSLIIRKDAYEMLRKQEVGKKPDLPPFG